MLKRLNLSYALNLWWRTRVALWSRPIWHAIYQQILRISRPRLLDRLVDRSSAIVIEAFPRSANTFLVWALRDSTDHPIKIAHHLHDLIQIERGLKYGLPIVVIIRKPIDAFVSYQLRSSGLKASTMLVMYESFYSRVLELADYIVILRYEDVIYKTDAVLARIHELLAVPEEDRRNISVSRVFDAVDQAERNLRAVGGEFAIRSADRDHGFATSVARPTVDKESRKQALVEDFENHHAAAIASADKLYEQVLERSANFDSASG